MSRGPAPVGPSGPRVRAVQATCPAVPAGCPGHMSGLSATCPAVWASIHAPSGPHVGVLSGPQVRATSCPGRRAMSPARVRAVRGTRPGCPGHTSGFLGGPKYCGPACGCRGAWALGDKADQHAIAIVFGLNPRRISLPAVWPLARTCFARRRCALALQDRASRGTFRPPFALQGLPGLSRLL